MILLPLLYYEYRNYVRYCSGLADDGTSLRPWCDQLLPSVYNYVQRAYWYEAVYFVEHPSALLRLLPLADPLVHASL